MKSLFKTNIRSTQVDVSLLIARVGISAMMLVHGLPKLGKLFSSEPVKFAEVFGMSPELSLILAVFSEVVCSLLILIGLGTRLATIPLIVTMLIAVFYVHGADPFSKQEMGLHYLLVYIVLLICGSGRYSLDQKISDKLN